MTENKAKQNTEIFRRLQPRDLDQLQLLILKKKKQKKKRHFCLLLDFSFVITPLGFMFVVENPFSPRIGKFDNCPISNKSKKDTLFTLHEKCCSTTPSKSSQAAADKVKAISSNND